MTTSALFERGTEPKTIEFEHAGRLHSPVENKRRLPLSKHIDAIPQQSEDARLPGFVAEALWNSLAWNKVSRNEADAQPYVEAYIESLTQLAQFQRDTDNLIRYACIANLEFRQGKGQVNIKARSTAMEDKLNELLAEAACDWHTVENVLSAKLVSQHVTTLRNSLEKSLRDAVGDFTRQFFELLARLVDRQICGVVEWRPNHCCRYHFFKRAVVQDNEGVVSQTTDAEFRDGEQRDPETGVRIIGKRTIRETHMVKNHHRFARHRHDVMNTVVTTVGNSRVVMPPAVTRMVEQIPGWLQPFVRVIDGSIFRETVTEATVRVSEWTEVNERDEPIFGCEPAVLIGSYVLTGWGPREVAKELARRETSKKEADWKRTARIARQRAPFFAVLTVILLLAAAWFLIQALQGAGVGIFVCLATIAAVGSFWQSAFDYGTLRQNPTNFLAIRALTTSFACQVLLGEWLVARLFHPLSWLLPILLASGAIVSYAVSCRFRPN